MRSCLQHLEWQGLCDRLDALVASPLVREGGARPFEGDDGWGLLRDPVAVERRLAEQDGLEAALQWRTELNVGAQLDRVVPLGSILTEASRGVTLEPGELLAAGDLADALTRLAPLREPPDPALLEIASDETRASHVTFLAAVPGLVPQASLAADLLRAITLGGPQGEPMVADAASPALARARQQVRRARQQLIRGAERMMKGQKVADALADTYWTEREGRVVLPVRSSGFSRAGAPGTVSGIIHGASTTGRTLFVEPSALIDDNNRFRESQMAARAEERRVLAELSARVGEVAEALQEGLVSVARLDRIRARLRLAESITAVRPTVVDPASSQASLEVLTARHPLMVLAGTEVVPNDLCVPRGGGLVISGPNAGGKTVALKTLGMCVLMARAGLRLPTSAPAVVPLYRSVITDVGDDQSIAANLSTFSAHIGHVIEALSHAQEDPAGTLVLLDEVAVGTDPEQGAALAEAIVCRLCGLGATVVVTTHYERLKLLATHGPAGKFTNAAVGFDLARLRPTFELRLGVPGSSSAIAVARRLGVDEQVLTEAESMLSDERLQVDVLLQALEAERVAMQEQREGLEAERKTLAAREARVAARERREEEQAEIQRAKAHKAATDELRALEDEIRRRRKQLRKSQLEAAPEGALAPTEAEARAFAKQARTAVARGRVPDKPAAGDVPRELQAGDRVFVESLGSEGEVVSVKGNKVTVQLPLARTTVDRQALRSRDRAPRPAPRARPVSPPSKAGRHFGADARPVEARYDNVFDLRGERAEDAMALLEVFLDRAIGDDQDVVILRHGHGSGALRKVLREHLPRLHHVKTHRPGLTPEGGDAVTVVWVKG
ncbi:MAG: Smr/MutS family protein [Deltaproteobacteria bacterium]|nr:Smr/MutS family protein [Deltaproteobacteria bacterium]